LTDNKKGKNMTIVTHALAPVLAVKIYDAIRLLKGKAKFFSLKYVLMLALAGALPDILGMHFSLQGRYTSWTHNIWFLAGIYPLYLLICLKYFRKNWLLLTNLSWLATAFHLYIDARSGGIALFNPYGGIIGDRLIPWHYWGIADLVLISLTIIFSTLIFFKEKKMTPLLADPVSRPKNQAVVEKIKIGHLVLCGLLAGLILNFGDFYLNGMILRHAWEEAMISLHRAPMGISTLLSFSSLNFVLGIIIIWLYLVFSVRFGRGYKTALITGTVIWFLIYFSGYLANYIMNLYPFKIVWVSIVWGFFAMTLAALAGTMSYDYIINPTKDV
jgi:hypothetical protein